MRLSQRRIWLLFPVDGLVMFALFSAKSLIAINQLTHDPIVAYQVGAHHFVLWLVCQGVIYGAATLSGRLRDSGEPPAPAALSNDGGRLKGRP